MQQLQQLSRETPEFHERLSEEQLGQYLAAAGNHEGKAIVLMGMQLNEDYGVSSLHRLYVDPQGEPVAHKGSSANQLGYCEFSFEPIAAVAKVTAADTIRYEITEAGDYYGKAIAGYMLDFSLRHPEISLRNLFGMTKGPTDAETRSPLRRLAIMQQLITLKQPIRTKDLEANLGEVTNTMRGQIQWLDEAGLITLESAHGRDLAIGYETTRPITLSKPLEQGKDLTNAVVNTLNNLPANSVINLDGIEDSVRKLGFGSQVGVRGRVGKILRTLAEQEHIKSMEGLDYHDAYKITLNDTQLDTITELVTILWDLQSGDPAVFAEGRRRGEAILAEPMLVRTLIAKAIAASPEANKVPRELRCKLISQYLGSNAAARTIDVAEALAGKNGLTRRSIEGTLQMMRKTGILTRVKDGMDSRWTVILDESHTEVGSDI